jgi:hypothetical protein
VLFQSSSLLLAWEGAIEKLAVLLMEEIRGFWSGSCLFNS